MTYNDIKVTLDNTHYQSLATPATTSDIWVGLFCGKVEDLMQGGIFFSHILPILFLLIKWMKMNNSWTVDIILSDLSRTTEFMIVIHNANYCNLARMWCSENAE